MSGTGSGWARRVAGLAASASLLVGSVLAAPAAAIPVEADDKELYVYGGVLSSWGFIADTEVQCVTSSPVLSVEDAEFGEEASAHDNAFDGALGFSIDGVGFDEANNRMAKRGESVESGFQPTGSVAANVTYEALPTKPVMRVLLALRNSSSSAQTPVVVFDNNLDSDGSSGVRSSSDGDQVLEPGDRWAVTSDHADTPTDVVLSWGLAGPGQVREQITAVPRQPDTTGCLSVRYNLRVPPEELRYLLLFVHLSEDNIAGGFLAGDYMQEKAYLFKGLGTGLKNRVVNWNL